MSDRISFYRRLFVAAGVFASVAIGQTAPSAPAAVLAPAVNGPADDPALAVTPMNQIYHARRGELECVLDFQVANGSAEDVVINDVLTSCGCSVPKLPAKPWKLAAGAKGAFQIVVDLRGKAGTLIKTATVQTAKGVKTLMFQIVIAAEPVISPDPESRARNMQTAGADRQAVFKGDCIRCHVTPAAGQYGQALYAAACGVCHEAEHRATMVPDLRHLGHETSRDFWKSMIVAGKPGTLMPGFSMDMGGPLNRAQIDSLADYLSQAFPSQPTAKKVD